MPGWAVHNYPLHLLKLATKSNLSDRELLLPNYVYPANRARYDRLTDDFREPS